MNENVKTTFSALKKKEKVFMLKDNVKYFGKKNNYQYLIFFWNLYFYN